MTPDQSQDLKELMDRVTRVTYNQGVEAGVLSVYRALIHWCIMMTSDVQEQSRRVAATSDFEKFLREHFPQIDINYPNKDHMNQ